MERHGSAERGKSLAILGGAFIRKPSRGVYRFGKKQHLCPDCADDLRRWLKTLKFADTGALREVVAEIEEADVDGTGDWAERIRKAVGL